MKQFNLLESFKLRANLFNYTFREHANIHSIAFKKSSLVLLLLNGTLLLTNIEWSADTEFFYQSLIISRCNQLFDLSECFSYTITTLVVTHLTNIIGNSVVDLCINKLFIILNWMVWIIGIDGRPVLNTVGTKSPFDDQALKEN